MAMAQAGAAAAAATGLLVFLLYSAIHRVEEGHLAVYYRYGAPGSLPGAGVHPRSQGLLYPALPSGFFSPGVQPLLFLLPSTCTGESQTRWPRAELLCLWVSEPSAAFPPSPSSLPFSLTGFQSLGDQSSCSIVPSHIC